MKQASRALLQGGRLTAGAHSGGAATPLSEPSRPNSAGRIDPTVYGRAAAAYGDEFAKWQARIDAALVDPTLSPEQRQAAAASLRAQQTLAANAVRRRIIEEEKQRARAAKRSGRRLLPKPKPTGHG